MCARRKKKNNSFAKILAFAIVALVVYYGKNAVNLEAGLTEQPTEVEKSPKPVESQPEEMVTAPETDKKLLPSYLTDRPEEIVYHDGFVLSYNCKHLLSNWVSWLLTAERTKGKEKRADNFQPDASIKKGPVAEDSDYRKSGFDRGHMCPAADCKHSRKSQNECFLLSNICPQTHSLNAGDWKELEELTRDWALRYDSIYVVCGPVIERDKAYQTIGENRVTVPERFFKVIWRNVSEKSAHAIGFVFDNAEQNKPLSSYVLTVDEVEKITGINFFSKFPKQVERSAEAICDIKQWKGLK